jgi:membrane-bound serine protease (ClpP class)
MKRGRRAETRCGRAMGLRRLLRVACWALAVAACLGTLVTAQKGAGDARRVVVLTVSGDVNPVLVDYIRRGIRVATERRAEMLLIRLDTPGGQLQNTRQIAQDLLAAEVPIGVYVWPDGGRAGSAGTFITIGAHVAGMAPATNLGAAHPVMTGGGGGSDGEESGDQLETLTEKVTNDSAALIRNLAKARGRDAEWAEKAVRESVVATAAEAAELGVVDFIAEDLEDFLRQADGMEVRLKSGERALKTASAQPDFLPMNWRESLLFPLANPNIAYILMMLGVYGLIFELKSPGFGGAGIVGAICLILALWALSVFELNVAGFALIVVGIALLFGELMTPTHGVLTLGGATALAIGSLILIDSPQVQISRPLIGGVVLSTVGFFVFALGAIVKSQKRKVVTGAKGLIGQIGEARTDIDPKGTVFVAGTWWDAQVEGLAIKEGTKVEVVKVEGLKLTVREASDASPE